MDEGEDGKPDGHAGRQGGKDSRSLRRPVTRPDESRKLKETEKWPIQMAREASIMAM